MTTSTVIGLFFTFDGPQKINFSFLFHFAPFASLAACIYARSHRWMKNYRQYTVFYSINGPMKSNLSLNVCWDEHFGAKIFILLSFSHRLYAGFVFCFLFLLSGCPFWSIAEAGAEPGGENKKIIAHMCTADTKCVSSPGVVSFSRGFLLARKKMIYTQIFIISLYAHITRRHVPHLSSSAHFFALSFALAFSTFNIAQFFHPFRGGRSNLSPMTR